jgi:hypothetical protein
MCKIKCKSITRNKDWNKTVIKDKIVRSHKNVYIHGYFLLLFEKCLSYTKAWRWSKRAVIRILHFLSWLYSPSGPRPPHCWGFEITFRHTTLGRTPLDEWSARCRDLYLTTHSTHKRQTSMGLAGFEFAIPVSERPQTHALDRAATVIAVSYLQ